MVEGDFIGLSASGSAALGNGASGVAIYAGASNNTIGGTVSGSRDSSRATAADGVYITDGATTGNVVEGDYIGTDRPARRPCPTTTAWSSRTGRPATPSAAPPQPPATSSRATTGMASTSSTAGPAATWSRGTYIGVTASGSAALGNGASGVAIYAGASNNTIGGTVPAPAMSSPATTATACISPTGGPPATWSKETISAPTPPARKPCPTTSAWSSRMGRPITPSAAPPHPPATSSRATTRMASRSSGTGPAATSSRETTLGSPPAAPRAWPTGEAACRSTPAPATTRSAGPSPAPRTSSRATGKRRVSSPTPGRPATSSPVT